MPTKKLPAGVDGKGRKRYDSAVMAKLLIVAVLSLAWIGCKSTGKESVEIHTVSNKEFLRLTEEGCQSTNVAPVLPSFRVMEQPLMAPVTAGGSSTNAQGGADSSPRLVAVGSVVTITVDEDASLNRQYIVPTGGMIEFPPVGRFAVEGLTPEEFAKTIEKALEKDYFQDATVNCVISAEPGATIQGVIYILGSVGRQGPLLLPKDEKFTVMKAILAVGGCGAFGNCGKVRLIRYGCDGKKYQTYVNVDRIMKLAEFETDMEVRNSDWILVPEKWLNF